MCNTFRESIIQLCIQNQFKNKNMKKIVVLSLIALTFSISSCKKSRTCTCTYNKTGTSDYETKVTTYNNVNILIKPIRSGRFSTNITTIITNRE